VFSYAWRDGWLKRYAVYCMHEQYNNAHALAEFNSRSDALHYCSYEAVFVRGELPRETALSQCIGFVRDAACGVEVDLDAIVNTPSSARTSSGLDALQVREFVHKCATALSPAYLHVAEGAPVLAHRKADHKTGKLIAYLVGDFIKGVMSKSP
jgi:formiminoglutamase